MVRNFVVALLLLAVAAPAQATPLAKEDELKLRALSDGYVEAWLHNDRQGVMGVLAPEAVFIPHHGVKPKIGWAEIDAFWFPGGKAVGTVTDFRHDITAVSGDEDDAIIYGRSDLSWQDDRQRYRWIGNFLFVTRKEQGRWVITHMMSSDEQPTVQDLKK